MDIRNVKEFFKDSSIYILIFFIIIIIVVFIVGLAQVVGSSMQPTLRQDDIVVVSKIHYRLFSVNRFDIVSFRHQDAQYLIKRVIGLPGEHIAYFDNDLYVDGEIVEEYFLDDIRTGNFELEKIDYQVIPENYYFVMGDNRDNSLDSRTIGLIKRDDLVGKSLLRIFPVHQIKIVR